MREIILPEAKPAYEWVNGRALQKVSPKRKHGLAQMRFALALENWAHDGGLGTVATEWRFRLQPPGEERRPLVPDVAFLSYERLPFRVQKVTDEPCVAPEAVVEVLSPLDRRADVEEKARVYLAAGTCVVFLVNTETQSVTVRDSRGERRVARGGLLKHDALPGFRLQIHRLFMPTQPK
jgi:Uma2 family endonuclease